MRRLGSVLLSSSLGVVVLAGCSGERPAEAGTGPNAGPAARHSAVPAPGPPAPARRDGGDGGEDGGGGSAEDGAVAVLHAWDRRRSAAWAAQDPGALRRLYLPGSRAGDRDVALLRRYVARGIRVPELRMQVWRAQVLVHRPRRVVLRVAERLATTQVRWAGAAVRIPQDGVQTRVVDLRRTSTGWRVASVSPARR